MTTQQKDTYTVTEIDKGGDHVSIVIIVGEDGSLRILDHSYGRSADEMYGEGRDVEHWLDLCADSVQKLMTKLTGGATPDAADDLAKLLVKKFESQNLALQSIKELCAEKGISYKEELWH